MDIPKSQYINIVKYTLQCMKELAETDKSYNLILDIAHYYDNKIRVDAKLSKTEFLELCKGMNIDVSVFEKKQKFEESLWWMNTTGLQNNRQVKNTLLSH